MTQQARPDWNAEMDRQIKATESAESKARDHEATIIEQRKHIGLLRNALLELMNCPIVKEQSAGIRDTAKRDYVSDPLDVAHAALDKTK